MGAVNMIPHVVLASVLMPGVLDAVETKSEAPWPAPVAGWKPVAPGEHPRLFFRKAEVQALRQRAQTAEGKMLVERTIFLLDGADKVREGKRFTMFDAAAFGFLWQMTGDKQYAELARQSQEMFWSPGALDKDDRYSLNPPNEEMRAGPSIYAVALAYDLCYDAWPAEYRTEQAQKMFTWKGRCKKNGHNVSLESMAKQAYSPNPVSNHYALQVGGAGLTLLALLDDPELTDEQRKLAREWYETGIIKQAKRVFTVDFGATGYFGEHGGPGVIAMSWTMTPWLKAERVAGGRDWFTQPTPEWLSLQFVLKTIAHKDVPYYANPGAGRGGYGGDQLEQNGGHHAGYFSQGLGAIQDLHRPAMRWVYEKFVEPYERRQYPTEFPSPTARSFDAFNYPHRPMYAFLNWPATAENPAKTVPKAAGDPHFGQYVFRNRWQDNDDTVVCITFGARTADNVRRSMVWGLGQQLTFGSIAPVVTGNPKIGQAVIDYWQPAEDGSGIVTAGGTSIGVDFSRASGAEAVVVMVGKGADGKLGGAVDAKKSKVQTVGQFQILTLSAAGKHPEAQLQGDTVVLGGQTVRHDGRNIVFGKMAGPPSIRQ
jgi:hypothetical protein